MWQKRGAVILWIAGNAPPVEGGSGAPESQEEGYFTSVSLPLVVYSPIAAR